MGVAAIGRVLTAVPGPWYGTPPFVFSFQWQRCNRAGLMCSEIVGAEAVTYVPTVLDAGASLRVRVEASNRAGASAATSERTIVAAATAATADAAAGGRGLAAAAATCNQNPVNRVLPTQNPSATVHVGAAISISGNGTWDPAAGTCANSQFRFAWFRNGSLVVDRGTNGAPYTTGAADLGQGIQVQVTYEYTTSQYFGASARANPTTVTNSPPNRPDSLSPPDGTSYTFQPGGSFTNPSFTARFTDPNGDPGFLRFFIDRFNGSGWSPFVSADGLGDPGCPLPGNQVGNFCFGRYFPAVTLTPGPNGTGNYAWYVVPRDVWGSTGATSETRGLVVWGTPTIPQLGPPADGATVPTILPDLTASSTDAEGDPISYRFQISTDTSFAGQSLLADSDFIATGTWTVPIDSGLRDGRTYYWRAIARDQDGQSADWSAPSRFRVRLPKLGTNDNWPMWSSGPMAVNEATGNLVLSVPTPSFPTAAGTLAAAITYNSLDNNPRRPVSGLGAGWTVGSTLEAPAYLVDLYQRPPDLRLDVVGRVSADGFSDYYQHIAGSTTYLPPPGDTSQLTKNTDNTYTLIDPNGTIYTFGVADPTTGAATLTGAETTTAKPGRARVVYSFDGSHRPLSLVALDGTTEIARLTFSWGCAGALVCVSGPDNQTWRYEGDGPGGTSGKLATVNNGSRDLLKVVYDGAGRPVTIRNANDLDPAAASPGYDPAHHISVAYTTAGLVASVSSGPISDQTPATSTTSFEYHPDLTGATRTDPTRSTHPGLAAGSRRVTDGYTLVRPPCQQAPGTCAGRSGSAYGKVFYDSLGQALEQIDPLGNTSQQAFNDSQQLVWSEDPAGNPSEFTYDPVDTVLTTATAPAPDSSQPNVRPVTRYHYDEMKAGTSSAGVYTPGPPLQGLQAAYYKNTNLTGRPDAFATEIQNGSFSFNWGATGPPAIGTATGYSVRFNGNLLVDTAGSYQLRTASDDSVRVTLDGKLAIENWDNPQNVATSEPIELPAGKHRITLKYKQTHSTPNSTLSLYLCNTTSGCGPADFALIPSGSLRPAWNNQTTVVSPTGRTSFNHFAEPWTGQPDYTLVTAAVNGTLTQLVSSTVYDDLGRPVQQVTPKGNAARTIDADGNLVGPLTPGYGTSFDYYPAGQTAAPQAPCPTGAAVNQLGLLRTETISGLTPSTSVYDSAGRPLSVSKAVGVVCSTYDPEGRLTGSSAPIPAGGRETNTFTYSPAAQVLTATNPLGTISSVYDEAGRTQQTTDVFGATAVFGFDADGNPLQRTATLPASSPQQTLYAYNDNDQLVQQTDPTGRAYAFGYDSRGNLISTQYPNGTYSLVRVLPTGWLAAVCNQHGSVPVSPPATGCPTGDPSPLADFVYAYNLDGQRTNEERTAAAAAFTTQYGYDTIGRLETLALPDGGSRRYCFDANFNRTAIQTSATASPAACGTPGAAQELVYDRGQTPGLDQLTSKSEAGVTTAYSYTGDGQVSSRGTDTLSWDGYGRNTGGTYPAASQTVTYTYDPAGYRNQRIAQAIPGGTVSNNTHYLLAGLYEQDATSGPLTTTLTAVDGPAGDLAHYPGLASSETAVSYLYYNGHGDLAATANQAGTSTATYTYDPFGAVNEPVAANTTVERWTARWNKKLDTSSSLIEMGARPYDPTIGRFLAVDPINGGSLNTYDYAAQDPINAYDLDGTICKSLSCLNKGAKKTTKAASHLVLKAAAVPPYGLYYLNYQVARGTTSPLLRTLTLPGQVIGLGGDAGIDWIKGHTVNNESIWDEHGRIYILSVHRGPQIFGPGLWRDDRGRRHADVIWPWSR